MLKELALVVVLVDVVLAVGLVQCEVQFWMKVLLNSCLAAQKLTVDSLAAPF